MSFSYNLDNPYPKDLHLTEFQKIISEECDNVKNLLIRKNQKYGSSVSRPTNVFAKMSSLEQIGVRCDDKLSRIRTAGGLTEVMMVDNDAEDTLMDLIGYLVLAKAVHREQLNCAKDEESIQ